MGTKGRWVIAEVVLWNHNQSEVLLRYPDGKEEWVNIQRIKKAYSPTAMAYITLPSFSSRHAGMEIKGNFCLER